MIFLKYYQYFTPFTYSCTDAAVVKLKFRVGSGAKFGVLDTLYNLKYNKQAF